MRFLADENFPLASARVLRERMHDVACIGEVSPGVADLAVLKQAVAEHRVLLTFDRDFGALAFLDKMQCPPGIVLLRFLPRTPTEAGQLMADLIRDGDVQLEGHFTVVNRERVRQRRLPPQSV